MKFGPKQYNRPTPKNIGRMFSLMLAGCKLAMGYIAATNIVPPNYKYETTLAITLLLEPAIGVFANLFGIKTVDLVPKAAGKSSPEKEEADLKPAPEKDNSNS